MTDSSTEPVALITGASRGLGAATAEALAARGWHVIAVARTTGALEELDDRIRAAGNPGATLVPLDITDDAGLQRMCVAIHERWGKVDLWLHTAIFAAPLSPAGHVPEKDWDRIVQVNIRATQKLIAYVEPLLKAAPDGLAVLPVDESPLGRPFMAAHGAAKAAQHALWDSWQAETRRIGPRVMRFAPRPMPTALRGRFFPGEDRSALTHPRDEAARMLAELDIAG